MTRQIKTLRLYLLLPTWVALPQEYANQTGEFASCGDCHCVPDNNGTDPCPEDQPATQFTVQHIETLLAVNPTNPFSIDCDPYTNQTCETVPARDPLTALGDTNAVCAFLYDYPDDEPGTCPTSYTAKTFASRDEALAAGYVLTHEGGCATCSTARDLAIYMTVIDQREEATQCALDALRSFELGKKCFTEDIGFTEACAVVWTYDALNTNEKCGLICARAVISGEPNNGPTPSCELNDCLVCNEVENGVPFRGYAGRTRRNSGVLSAIARPCSSIAQIEHNDPCEAKSITPAPTSATIAPTSATTAPTSATSEPTSSATSSPTTPPTTTPPTTTPPSVPSPTSMPTAMPAASNADATMRATCLRIAYNMLVAIAMGWWL